MMINTLLNIIINARLKLLLKLNIITCKIHNQFIMINLIFNSKKIQSMICKCEVWIDLHQKSDHLSIITELNLQTISAQFLTRWFWKKLNTEALNAYLWIHLSSDHSLNSKAEMNDRVTEIIKVLQEIIKKFTLWAKSSN